MKKLWNIVTALAFSAAMMASCGNDPATPDDDDPGKEPEPGKTGWTVSTNSLSFGANKQTLPIDVTGTPEGTVIDGSKLGAVVATAGEEWISTSVSGTSVNVLAEKNYTTKARMTSISVTYGEEKRTVSIKQDPGEATGDKDATIKVLSATADSEMGDRLLIHSYDGDTTTFFNSVSGEVTYPFNMSWTLQTPNRLDYIMMYPRKEGNNWGAWDEFTVYYCTADAPDTKVELTKAARGNANLTAWKFALPTPIENVKTVYVEITKAYENRVSVAEMEFHTVTKGEWFDYKTIFANDLFTELKAGVTAAEIRGIPEKEYRDLAYGLLDGTYGKDFRVAQFRPYTHPSLMATTNRIGTYSLRDNPTGIYVEAGDVFYVHCGDTKGQSITLTLQNLQPDYSWGANKTLFVEKGQNVFTAPMSGLLYVDNITYSKLPLHPTTDAEKSAIAAKTVDLHFVSGKVQGYYRRGVTTMEQWTKMIADAKYTEIDIIGNYAHLSWLTATYKTTPQHIEEMIGYLDGVVYQQMEFTGVVKHNRLYTNRMYMHWMQSGNPFASSYRTAYNNDASDRVSVPSAFKSKLWVFGHEVGHINQVAGFKWAGAIEVSNNVMTLYNQQQTNGKAERLTTGSYSNETRWDLNEDGDYDDPGETFSNLYDAAIASIVRRESPLCLKPKGDGVWHRLVPYWQLHLYVSTAGQGNKDFYPDLFELYRTCPEMPSVSGVVASSPSGNPGQEAYDAAYAAALALLPKDELSNNGYCQLKFAEFACQAAQLDLTDFLIAWGFLRPAEMLVDDYGLKAMVIPQKDVDETIARIKAMNLPKPAHTVEEMLAIRDSNVDTYKK